ncbi:MAG TPA: hypothetical protein VFU97_13030 [Xanthobacteraceae bacterium]|jgi:hypothetical protein|nr:hypothetical protein [Xanthobacteraceae bacterium]
MTCERTSSIHVGGDMSLNEALADPLIRALMAADRVDPARLKAELAETARRFARVSG